VRSDDRSAGDLAALQHGLEGQIRTDWTAADWLARFSSTIEGDAYQAAVAPRTGDPEAGVLMRIAERGSPTVRIAVVVELIDRFPRQGHASTLLRWVEQRAIEARADAIIGLSPMSATDRRPYRGQGYWTAPETYTLLYRPTSPRGKADSLRDPAAWRFSLAEHDAF
jgi:hypothetical protein